MSITVPPKRVTSSRFHIRRQNTCYENQIVITDQIREPKYASEVFTRTADYKPEKQSQTKRPWYHFYLHF